MCDQASVEKLKAKFSSAVLDVIEFRGELTVMVEKGRIVEIGTFLRDECGYDFLCDLCGVDYMGQQPRFMVVYNLYNITTKQRLRVKVGVDEQSASVDTVSGIWSTANWPERECWDLMGISFNNHPDLRRILMAADWEGHPLRKDYPVQGPDREPYQSRLS
ncbi:MAG: NADH-quinone oxidoreductase subunit C [Desulfuromonas sp.]|nr:MAG: NADH-quinone oxidoreductase subunit C [Desulfuromonas sp.]